MGNMAQADQHLTLGLKEDAAFCSAPHISTLYTQLSALT